MKKPNLTKERCSDLWCN